MNASEKTPARTRTGRPTQAEAAELEHRLRKAALETFLDHGFEASSMETVARAAGITKRTLYARYPDKRALFATVIPWALARHRWDEPAPEATGTDLTSALTAIARSALARALDPEIVRLSRMAMTESARFPEFAASAQSMAWSPRIRAVVDLLRRHADEGTVVVDDLEIAAEQFLALVAAVPARLAAFGVMRDPEVEERHLLHAVGLFLHGVLAR